MTTIYRISVFVIGLVVLWSAGLVWIAWQDEPTPTQAPAVILPAGDLDGDHRRLLAAIRQVESGGNSQAVGDGGTRRGAYQIYRRYWADGIARGGVYWDYDVYVWDPQKSEQVIRWYWLRYGAKTDEQRARQHNGGPQGHRKAATLGYWAKVTAAMEQNQ